MRYAAFLRGINVGGHRVTSEELRSHLVGMGFDDVATFRASGNLILSGEGDDADRVSARVEAGLTEALGYGVPTFARDEPELLALADHDPFPADVVAASAGKLQVAMLRDRPNPGEAETVLSLSSDADRLAVDGRQLYWLPSGGMSDSELDLKLIEATLGPMTIRTKGTVEQIRAKFFSA